jgi:hypothetical protein
LKRYGGKEIVDKMGQQEEDGGLEDDADGG